ncbi:MAG TPA: class I SAM-dependent methyltransferase [Streptomyces sp.]|uniref:class I SAM-dependent methyltransferase n=1 Tax=Streptomyces sp. TaxID=1931 RepID=UPI002D4CECAF|nr:class I SAM-dependent methyltransferase [Streptomyces sp.]HZG04487.1 class I SAM-dependent methyltransferase [Streptomyces sp.]
MAGRRVLDLGCGEGIIARAVAARRAAVLGIDPSPRMIEHAREAEWRVLVPGGSLVFTRPAPLFRGAARHLDGARGWDRAPGRR